MDLIETRGATRRHPWELSRARAVERIVRSHGNAPVRSILDWGCGDVFTGRYLLERLGAESLVGVDPNLTDEQRTSFAGGDRRVALYREGDEFPARRFDLMLLCDVIEHVPDDVALVEPLARRFLENGGRLVVTVPAFQALFSSHDVTVKHYRRYRLAELESVLRAAGLELQGSGYLFGSLLPARFISNLFSSSKPPPDDGVIGLSTWRGGDFASKLVETVLSFDNSLLLGLAEYGVKPPGLSAWASCVRRSS